MPPPIMQSIIRQNGLPPPTLPDFRNLGTVFVATGAVLALLGSLSVLAGVVLLIGDQWLPADLYWVAALIVLLISGAIAAWFAKRGMALLSPSQLAPNETVTTLKEDKEWLKQRLTSGVTSS